MDTHSFPDQSHLIIRPISHVNEYDFSHVHRHEYFEIFLFETGNQGYQVIDFAKYPLRPYSLYIVCPDQIHLLRRRADENGLLIQFTKEFLFTAIPRLQPDWLITLNSSPSLQLSQEQFQRTKEMVLRLQELLAINGPFGTPQTESFFSYSIFHILELINASGSASPHDSLSMKFMTLAQHNFITERQVAYYATELGVSTNTLRRSIGSRLGRTPLEILHSMLLLEIKRLMTLNELSHKEISYQLNFDSPSSYNKFILKQTGKSPSEVKTELVEIHKS